mmetsp:Transcript_31139/g.51910  ORF Transcript_31139/g.51910 Transcript_31139/m.51910 type:complete len:90 (+) Transcript_31139:40-309(+)
MLFKANNKLNNENKNRGEYVQRAILNLLRKENFLRCRQLPRQSTIIVKEAEVLTQGTNSMVRTTRRILVLHQKQYHGHWLGTGHWKSTS